MKKKLMRNTGVARTDRKISMMIETATTCANITTLKVNNAATLIMTVACTEMGSQRAGVAESTPCQTGHQTKTASLRLSTPHLATSKAV